MTSPAAMPSSSIGKKTGFIGAGNMAEALAQEFIAKQKIEAKDIWCTDAKWCTDSKMDMHLS